jgi:hypothetical protein
MNTAPLKWKHFPIYTTFNTSFVNDTPVRDTPQQSLLYRRTIATGVDFRKDMRIQKKTTLTPIVGYQESWANRLVTSTGVVTDRDQYVGVYTLGSDLRQRLNRAMNASLRYRYQVRLAPNTTRPDATADDHGVVNNQVTGDVTTRLGRSTLLTLASGYDYRNDPLSVPGKYRHVSSRVIAPNADLQWEVKHNVNVFFRETYSLSDPTTLQPVRTPANTSGELQWGDPNAATFFSQGFSYSKQPVGAPSQLYLNNKLKFYLTRKWYVDLLLSYRAQSDSGTNYSKVFPVEKTVRLVRDLHCWILRMEFTQRPDRTDASFYIDLKANANSSQNVFDRSRQQPAYSTSTRNDGPPLDQLFPAGPTE